MFEVLAFGVFYIIDELKGKTQPYVFVDKDRA